MVTCSEWDPWTIRTRDPVLFGRLATNAFWKNALLSLSFSHCSFVWITIHLRFPNMMLHCLSLILEGGLGMNSRTFAVLNNKRSGVEGITNVFILVAEEVIIMSFVSH